MGGVRAVGEPRRSKGEPPPRRRLGFDQAPDTLRAGRALLSSRLAMEERELQPLAQGQGRAALGIGRMRSPSTTPVLGMAGGAADVHIRRMTEAELREFFRAPVCDEDLLNPAQQAAAVEVQVPRLAVAAASPSGASGGTVARAWWEPVEFAAETGGGAAMGAGWRREEVRTGSAEVWEDNLPVPNNRDANHNLIILSNRLPRRMSVVFGPGYDAAAATPAGDGTGDGGGMMAQAVTSEGVGANFHGQAGAGLARRARGIAWWSWWLRCPPVTAPLKEEDFLLLP